MVQNNNHPQKPKIVRLSISFTTDEHKSLQKLSARHDPPLPIQYLVQYAVKQLLNSAAATGARMDFPWNQRDLS